MLKVICHRATTRLIKTNEIDVVKSTVKKTTARWHRRLVVSRKRRIDHQAVDSLKPVNQEKRLTSPT